MTDVLNLKMGKNDAGAKTVKAYLKALLMQLWDEGESFSGKRPFGNGGWEYDLYKPLIKHGVIQGKLDRDGYVADVDSNSGFRAIEDAINELCK